jgi:hypothetical protein
MRTPRAVRPRKQREAIGGDPHVIAQTKPIVDMAALAALIDANGAQKDGAGWTCTVEQWREARASTASPAPKVTSPANDTSTIDGMLHSARLRGTR